MRRLLTGAALAVLMSGFASPLFAVEPPIGSRLGDRTEKQKTKNEKESAFTAHELAGCIIVKRGSAARDLLDSRSAEDLLKRNRSIAQSLSAKPIQQTYYRPWYAFTGRHISLDEMATCVADTSPAGVIALLGTPPFSDDESAAFGQLMRAMGPCLVAGTELDAKREPLRAALAEALYQRAYHPEEETAVAPDAAAKK